MIYKSLQTLSLVLSLAFFISGFAKAQETAVETSPFIVEGVEVDITADNAIHARDQAFDAAQAKAFTMLAERMLPEGEAASYKNPDLDVISSLIKDYEVTKEKLSSVRYIGTYSFHFDEAGVRRIFKNSVGGDSYAGTSGGTAPSIPTPAGQILILPFYQKGAETDLWSQDNAWMSAWSRNSGNFLVPIGELKDVQDIGDNQALNYDSGKLKEMLARYGAREAVVLIAAPDAALARAEDENQGATGAVNISIYRTDRNGAEYADQVTLSAQQGQTLGQLMDFGVMRVQNLLQQDWKQKAMAVASEINSIDVIVPIRSLADWSSTQRTLERVGGIQDIMLQTLSPREARIKISYQGDQQRFMMGLEQAGLALMKATPDPNASGLFVPSVYILVSKNAAREMSIEGNNAHEDKNYSRQF